MRLAIQGSADSRPVFICCLSPLPTRRLEIYILGRDARRFCVSTVGNYHLCLTFLCTNAHRSPSAYLHSRSLSFCSPWAVPCQFVKGDDSRFGFLASRNVSQIKNDKERIGMVSRPRLRQRAHVNSPLESLWKTKSSRQRTPKTILSAATNQTDLQPAGHHSHGSK